MTNQTVILAAGKGKRMGGNIPKVLIMLKNKPLILHLVHSLENITQLIKPVVVIGFQASKVRAVLGDDFFYAYQDEQLGTAHAVMAARGKINAENILVLYGDMPFIKAESLRELMKLHRDSNANISMLTSIAPNFEGELKTLASHGRIIRNPRGDITRIVEVKDASEVEKQILETNPGIYMFNTRWLWENIDKIKNQNAQGEFYLTDIVAIAIETGEKVYSAPIPAKEVIGINSPEDLRLAESL